MSARKICKPKGCRGSPRCDHRWWFDVMCRGKRWRMRVDEFAFARGAAESVASKQTAERVWEPQFVAEIMAGGDPRVRPTTKKAESETLTVAEFLDRYFTNYVEAEGLQDPVTIKGRLKAIKAVIGNEQVRALEKAEPIQRFNAAYRQGRAIATVNGALSTLRAAVNWGRFQDPPLLTTSPFHRFGASIRAKEETKRDRRVGPDEERALLEAALTVDSQEHKWAGASMHDRIIGALETCCRKGEMLRIQNRHVDRETVGCGMVDKEQQPEEEVRSADAGGVHRGESRLGEAKRVLEGGAESTTRRSCNYLLTTRPKPNANSIPNGAS